MLDKCVNPSCSTRFRYFRDGQLFHVERDDGAADESGRPSHHVEHFWLCGACSQHMQVRYSKEQGLRIVPRQEQRAA